MLFGLVAWATTLKYVLSAERLVIFAPSSMTDVLNRVAVDYENQSGVKVLFSFSGTAQLARQLEYGAPADVFITADGEWMKWAIDRQLVEHHAVSPIAGNQLVVAARNEVENWENIEILLTQTRFAMAEPNAVPAGRYAKQALISRGIWDKAAKQAVFGDNVRVTLRRLALGEVAAAIVYESDVSVEPTVKTIHTFPTNIHEPIVYWSAKVNRSKVGGNFINFLKNATARPIFKQFGFLPPPSGAALPDKGN